MVALNMLVGPFYEPFLKEAVLSVASLCDEFVFVFNDKTSNVNLDKLNGIVKTLPNAKIIEYPENERYVFSRAREIARINSVSDWIFRLDADEVFHEQSIDELRNLVNNDKISAIEIAFYHFMVYPWLYQYIEPKIVLFKRRMCNWHGDVHERLNIAGDILKRHDILYYHYGYCRGPEEVFKRWKLYAELEGKPDWYNGVNPRFILNDRLNMCRKFDMSKHPNIIKDVLGRMFKENV